MCLEKRAVSFRIRLWIAGSYLSSLAKKPPKKNRFGIGQKKNTFHSCFNARNRPKLSIIYLSLKQWENTCFFLLLTNIGDSRVFLQNYSSSCVDWFLFEIRTLIRGLSEQIRAPATVTTEGSRRTGTNIPRPANIFIRVSTQPTPQLTSSRLRWNSTYPFYSVVSKKNCLYKL